MTEGQTCGKGLAEHSTLPAKLSELAGAMAEVLEVHQGALDLKDENSRKERDAYTKLTDEFRRIAGELKATAQHMAGYRDLPMGRHDPKVMTSAKPAKAFETFVKSERELVTFLQQALERDQKMLAAMR
jgi:ribosomal protein L32E